MKKFIILFLFTCLWANISFSQVFTTANPKFQGNEPALKNTGVVTKLSTDQILKKPGHYTTEQWHELIDTFWGPGVPTETKLKLFDDFWNTIDQSYGGFPNLDVNWDSLRSVYRPVVEAGVSRGRFAGILSSLTRALQDVHDGVSDLGIDSTLGFFSFYTKVNEYPNYPSFYYRPGIPIINLFFSFRTNFGAGLTLLPDSNIIVYSVMPNHPLGLQPGDIILGYDGIPWKAELNDLLRAELPTFQSYYGTSLSSSTAAANHTAMISAGINWGLFDTIDVVKYSTNDTLHYPTSLLAAITPPYFIATEQMPVKGVLFPNIHGGKTVSWGIVEGTNIGYIYAWDWSESSTVPFGQAVDELMHIRKVSGLILDFRKNLGGAGSADQGFKHLFNSDPTSNLSGALRLKGDNHYAFSVYSGSAYGQMFTTSEIFDHPIAVLLGPACGSNGDWWAFMLRFHPMVRFFGKPTNGAYRYSTVDFANTTPTYPYYRHIDDGCLYSKVNNEGYMIHKSFPVDEEVWLTRDGVASGEDEVVNTALEWIQNLSHAYDVSVQPVYSSPENEEITLTAKVENPNSHELSVYAKITGMDKVPVDSILLFDDGGHGDGYSGDGIWGAKWPMPSREKTYAVNLTTEDAAAGSLRTLPSVVRFTSVGPVVLDSISITKNTTSYSVKTFIKNESASTKITKASVKLICNDPWVQPFTGNVRSLPDISPGGVVSHSGTFLVKQIDALFNGIFNFKVQILSDGVPYWNDSLQVIVRSNKMEAIHANIFKLEQNYPNPFNSVTTINWQIPKAGKASLKVYDISGREVATIFDGYKPTGKYESRFNAGSLPGGVYFYKLRAEEYTAVRKMLLLK